MQWSAIFPVVLTLFITRPQTSSAMKTLSNLCYPKWALEALVTANAERYVLKFPSFIIMSTLEFDNSNPHMKPVTAQAHR